MGFLGLGVLTSDSLSDEGEFLSGFEFVFSNALVVLLHEHLSFESHLPEALVVLVFSVSFLDTLGVLGFHVLKVLGVVLLEVRSGFLELGFDFLSDLAEVNSWFLSELSVLLLEVGLKLLLEFQYTGLEFSTLSLLPFFLVLRKGFESSDSLSLGQFVRLPSLLEVGLCLSDSAESGFVDGIFGLGVLLSKSLALSFVLFS